MKVIDLLNKIAKGEEVPKHILFRNYDYFFEDNEYRDFVDHCLDYEYLNDEVEIIEEEKEIKKIDMMYPISNEFNSEIGGLVSIYNNNLGELKRKIDELIDAVNELRGRK